MEILFVLGTKAQFIKTIPMINLAIERNIKVTLVDLKQHPEKAKNLREKIVGVYNYVEYIDNKNDLGTYPKLIFWFMKMLFKITFTKSSIFQNNLSIVHGDTLSALVGALLIRRNKGKLVLLEAGKGFPGMLKHFPESFIRYYVAKFSHYLIINGKDQLFKLKEWKVKGKILEISRNTIYDSLDLVNLEKKKDSKEIVVSIHRTENINSKSNMKKLTKTLCATAIAGATALSMTSAHAWGGWGPWGGGDRGYGSNDWLGDGWGDGDMDGDFGFNMSGSGRGHGRGYGRGYGDYYGRHYGGYGPYGYGGYPGGYGGYPGGPYGGGYPGGPYGAPAAPVAPAAPAGGQ